MSHFPNSCHLMLFLTLTSPTHTRFEWIFFANITNFELLYPAGLQKIAHIAVAVARNCCRLWKKLPFLHQAIHVRTLKYNFKNTIYIKLLLLVYPQWLELITRGCKRLIKALLLKKKLVFKKLLLKVSTFHGTGIESATCTLPFIIFSGYLI